jgi:acetoin utilization deacetylase AcuC-like enzyme
MFKVAYHPSFAHPLPEGHRFPMEKYELIPQQLLHEGTIEHDQIFFPEPVEEWIPALVHDEKYLQKLKLQKLSKQEERKLGFPQSKALYDREMRITQGTIENVHNAFNDGIALNVAGGTHHAGKNFAEGFCLINDQAVGAGYALHQKLAKNILILDLDVHQGNGTADILGQHKSIYTFSMHGAKNYPIHKPPSHWDIPLEDDTNDEKYLDILHSALRKLDKTKQWELAFFQSGVDILSSDKLGRLNVSLNGCKERDLIVLNWFKNRGIPLVVSMGGGYSPDIKTIVEAHCNTFRLASQIYI